MFICPLSELVSIRTGFQFRGATPYSPTGKYTLIHLRDSSDALSLEDQDLNYFDQGELKKEDLVSRDDILLRSKGNNHYAVLVDKETTNTVVSSLSLVIRCTDPRIKSSYLTWYLNQPPSQSFLTKISAGTSINVVNKGALGGLEIPLRSIPSQNAIGELYQLQLKKEHLTKQLLQRGRKLLNAQMLSLETNFSNEVVE